MTVRPVTTITQTTGLVTTTVSITSAKPCQALAWQCGGVTVAPIKASFCKDVLCATIVQLDLAETSAWQGINTTVLVGVAIALPIVKPPGVTMGVVVRSKPTSLLNCDGWTAVVAAQCGPNHTSG
jgi:hypothetical protein